MQGSKTGGLDATDSQDIVCHSWYSESMYLARVEDQERNAVVSNLREAMSKSRLRLNAAPLAVHRIRRRLRGMEDAFPA